MKAQLMGRTNTVESLVWLRCMMPECLNGARYWLKGFFIQPILYYCEPCKLSFPGYTWQYFKSLAPAQDAVINWPEIVYEDILDADVLG